MRLHKRRNGKGHEDFGVFNPVRLRVPATRLRREQDPVATLVSRRL
jgi:hypothetical protein